MKPSSVQKVSELEILVRNGHRARARNQLRKMTSKGHGPDTLLRLARLSNRLGMPHKALLLLSPLVRPKTQLPEKPQMLCSLKVEYAAALIRLGATREAKTLLESVSEKEEPLKLLQFAFVLIHEWNYAQCIPILDRFLKLNYEDRYLNHIAEANLAAALVHEKDSRAIMLMDALLKKLKTGPTAYLAGHIALLKVEYYFQLKSWSKCHKVLQLCEAHFQDPSPVDLLLLHKWKLLTELYEKPLHCRSREQLYALRKKAVSLPHWETVRSCDYHLAVAFQDSDMARKVFFATPFASFRKDLLSDFGSRLDLGAYYDWAANAAAKKPAIDLRSVQFQKKAKLAPGTAPYRLLSALCADLYQPKRTESLFGYTWPTENYTLRSSNLKVRQVVKRLRRLLKSANSGLQVLFRHHAYRVEPSFESRLRLYATEQSADGYDVLFDTLKEKVGETGLFSAKDACNVLGVSHATAVRILKEQRDKGTVALTGSGPNQRYKLTG